MNCNIPSAKRFVPKSVEQNRLQLRVHILRSQVLASSTLLPKCPKPSCRRRTPSGLPCHSRMVGLCRRSGRRRQRRCRLLPPSSKVEQAVEDQSLAASLLLYGSFADPAVCVVVVVVVSGRRLGRSEVPRARRCCFVFV